MNKAASTIWDSLKTGLSVVYPQLCPGCESPLPRDVDLPLCANCQDELYPIEPPFCSFCCEKFHGELLGDVVCQGCKNRKPAFDFARAGYHAHELLRELIHEFKYSRQMHLAPLLGQLLEGALNDRRFANDDWILTPVPLHRARKQERHFNQAEELCRHVAKARQLPWKNLLRRTRYTSAQAQLERRDRLKNLAKAFDLEKSKRLRDQIRGANIILVDDILTTGSTAHECAKVLKRDGKAHKVGVITIARAGHPPRG